jgi:hypothetical protein
VVVLIDASSGDTKDGGPWMGCVTGYESQDGEAAQFPAKCPQGCASSQWICISGLI